MRTVHACMHRCDSVDMLQKLPLKDGVRAVAVRPRFHCFSWVFLDGSQSSSAFIYPLGLRRSSRFSIVSYTKLAVKNTIQI